MQLGSHDNGYDKLEHWPPTTYRDRLTVNPETNKDFVGVLETKNKAKHNMELQPWIPFCDGRCTFCYFPVNCDKQNTDLYIEAFPKAIGKLKRNGLIKVEEGKIELTEKVIIGDSILRGVF